MIEIYQGDSLSILKTFDDECIHSCITSPPYWGLRDYRVEGQLGLEKTPEEYVQKMVEVFREVRRVLRDDGTLWLNLGDSYAARAKNRTVDQSVKNSSLGGGKTTQSQCLVQQDKCVSGLKQKDLVGIPWRVAFALQADGWYLRQDIIWHKPNPMPESVRDRCTKAHEYIFLFSKSPKYYFDIDAIKEPARYGLPNSPGSIKSPYGQGFTRRGRGGWKNTAMNIKKTFGRAQNLDKAGEKAWDLRQKRSVWTVSPKPFKEAHFATFPPDLIEPCVLAGCPVGGKILDPFFGAGTTGVVAKKHSRNCYGIELNPEYIEIANKRLGGA